MVLARISIRIKSPLQQRGSVLIAIVGTVLVLALAWMAKSLMEQTQRRLTQQTGLASGMTNIDTAMVNFVMHKNRLPCPADGRIASWTAGAGVENRNAGTGACNLNQQHGVVPWVTLGLAETNSKDPWNGRFTYRVDPALAGNLLLMNMSGCDTVGMSSATGTGACRVCAVNTAACTSPANFLTGKGLDVWTGSASGTPWALRLRNRMGTTGAAYVVISHGATGAGAYNAAGVLQPGSVGMVAIVPTPMMPPYTQAAGDDELLNFASLAVYTTSAIASTYRDGVFSTSRTNTNFDDFISYPMLHDVLKRASLNERH